MTRNQERFRYIGRAGWTFGQADPIEIEFGNNTYGQTSVPLTTGSNTYGGDRAYFAFSSGTTTAAISTSWALHDSAGANVTPHELFYDNSSGDGAGQVWFLMNQGASPAANSANGVNYPSAYKTGFCRLYNLVGNASIGVSDANTTVYINFANSGNGYDASISVNENDLILLLTVQRLGTSGYLTSNNMTLIDGSADAGGFSMALYKYRALTTGTFTTNLVYAAQPQQCVYKLFTIVDER